MQATTSVVGTGARPLACRKQRSGRRSRSTAVTRAIIDPNGGAVLDVGAASRVQLGDTDLNVSICCLGTMTWGKQNTEAEAHEQLSYAFDEGVNFMDTAEMYPVPTEANTQGSTDRYIGTWMKERKREEIILATKVSGYSERIDWLPGEGRVPCRVNENNIIQSVDASLQRLQTDYVDLLQIHWPDRYVPIFGGFAYNPEEERLGAVPFEEQLEALDKVITAGKVRHIGVSNETSYGVMEFCRVAEAAGLPKICSIQNSYSLIVRVPFEVNLAEVCHQKNVGLLAYSPLAGGVLSGKYLKGSNEGSRLHLFPGFMDRYKFSAVEDAVREYAAVAAACGLTPSELALAWCKSRWFCTSTIIGATAMPQLRENIGAFNKTLTPDVIEAVEDVFQRYRDPSYLKPQA